MIVVIMIVMVMNMTMTLLSPSPKSAVVPPAVRHTLHNDDDDGEDDS